MKHYIVECQVFDEYLRFHRHLEVIRESLDDAISEIEMSKYGDPYVEKFLDEEIFYGEFISGTRRFMFTFKTKGGKQISYIVHEIEETSETRNAIESGDYTEAHKLLEELF